MEIKTLNDYSEASAQVAVYTNRLAAKERGSVRVADLLVSIMRLAAMMAKIAEKSAKVVRDKDRSFDADELRRDLFGVANDALKLIQSVSLVPPHETIRAGFSTTDGLVYVAMKMLGEAGEVVEEVVKHVENEDKDTFAAFCERLNRENGDVLWYVSALAVETGSSLEEVANLNIEKLRSRVRRGVLHGDGSDR